MKNNSDYFLGGLNLIIMKKFSLPLSDEMQESIFVLAAVSITVALSILIICIAIAALIRHSH